MTLTLNLSSVVVVFPQDTPAYDVILSSQVWLQTDQQFRRPCRNSHLLIVNPRWDLHIEDSEPVCLHDTPLMIIHHHTNQVWLNG